MARTNGIVQEYDPSKSSLANDHLWALSKQAALENGIERPRGYKVSWHHNPDVEEFHFGPSHPMKPWRLRLTKNLIFAYGMDQAMDVVVSRKATKEEMAEFHREDYLEFLEKVTPDLFSEQMLTRYNLGSDCPVFSGLFDFCSLYTGASVEAAHHLVARQSDIAINWAGGLHHAKKYEASGFCYVNDIVIAIIELLRFHPRVLYIDIDVHHGDGVEQAFWSTDRVMTLSFHKYDSLGFFPGTGDLSSHGPTPSFKSGSNFSLNVPLNDGIEDDDYIWLFKQIVQPTVDAFHPSAIVLQCGADSLAGDRLGCFNLNIPAHGACLEFVKSFKLPLLVLGGGGYTPRNVARLWAYETSLCIGSANLNPSIPEHTPLRHVFEPDGSLLPRLSEGSRFENKNSREYLWSIIQVIHESLKLVSRNPSVHMDYFPPGIDQLRRELDAEMEEKLRQTKNGRRYLEADAGAYAQVVGRGE